MIHQGLIIVFGNHAYILNPGVGHAGEGKVDKAIATAYGDRAHAAMGG
jgi:hypothetical protein